MLGILPSDHSWEICFNKQGDIITKCKKVYFCHVYTFSITPICGNMKGEKSCRVPGQVESES